MFSSFLLWTRYHICVTTSLSLISIFIAIRFPSMIWSTIFIIIFNIIFPETIEVFEDFIFICICDLLIVFSMKVGVQCSWAKWICNLMRFREFGHFLFVLCYFHKIICQRSLMEMLQCFDFMLFNPFFGICEDGFLNPMFGYEFLLFLENQAKCYIKPLDIK